MAALLLATLGIKPESLWDSSLEFPKGISPDLVMSVPDDLHEFQPFIGGRIDG
jgi:hypothetical protein